MPQAPERKKSGGICFATTPHHFIRPKTAPIVRRISSASSSANLHTTPRFWLSLVCLRSMQGCDKHIAAQPFPHSPSPPFQATQKNAHRTTERQHHQQ
jgi:hypothetical protein